MSSEENLCLINFISCLFCIKTQFEKMTDNKKTWHDTHAESFTFGQRLADSVANGMGSWKFIIIQTVFTHAQFV